MRAKGTVRLGGTVAAFALAALGVAAPQAQAAATGASVAPDCHGICVLGVRAATHPDFDRIVIDLGEGTIPTWTATESTEPLTCCADPEPQIIPITGKTYLRIQVASAGTFDWNTSTSVYTSPRWEAYGFPSLKGQGLYGTNDPENRDFPLGLALGDHSSYKIFKLTSPNRIVVDINH
ncbi:hypothetical protein ACIGN6_24440 [Streptomyces sp. NPDC053792]|uniref:AMIN-like domain-containing (lipo)protein n=1 Tax=Streptomyces sp. NPDC053792 TaxID=3365716 RepID=UPI0037D83263